MSHHNGLCSGAVGGDDCRGAADDCRGHGGLDTVGHLGKLWMLLTDVLNHLSLQNKQTNKNKITYTYTDRTNISHSNGSNLGLFPVLLGLSFYLGQKHLNLSNLILWGKQPHQSKLPVFATDRPIMLL